MSHMNEVITFDPKTGKWSYAVTYDHSWLLKENKEAKKDAGNGWTKDRTMRKIGKIPYELYVDPHFRALTTDERHLFLKWFLDKRPEFRTVEHIITPTPSPGHVIIK